MSARRQIIAALSEDSYGGIATLQDVQRAEQLVDAHRAEVLAEIEARLAAMASEADRLAEAMEHAGDDSAPTMYAQYTGLRRARDEVRRIAARVGEKATATAATATPLTVYRASHDSIVMGHYTTRETAMDHVHAVLANEEGGDVTARVIWRADDPEADEPEWECWLFDADMADDSPTGYLVTPVEVASEYEPEDDE
jgi:hypothetical protein